MKNLFEETFAKPLNYPSEDSYCVLNKFYSTEMTPREKEICDNFLADVDKIKITFKQKSEDIMKKIKIYGWHGNVWTAFNEKVTSLFPDAKYVELDNLYELDDISLSEFVEKWDDKFICFKRDDYWLIGVTLYNSFNQR